MDPQQELQTEQVRDLVLMIFYQNIHSDSRKIFRVVENVTGHFVPRRFRTQVISYHFGHFVPTFIFNLVISYPVWSFRTHFVPSLVISYLLLLFARKLFWSFRTYFLLFRTQVISYPKSFRTQVIMYPLPN